MPILVSLLVLTSLLSPIIPSQIKKVELPVSNAKAELQTPPLNIKAQAVYVSDAKTGDALISYQKNQNWSIASLTKVMTALVLMEENPDLNKVITLQKEDFVGGATMRVPVGTKLTMRDLLYSSLMSSANNSTNALYKGTNLSRQEFINKMNEKAKSLGLKDTRLTELSGLDPENRSTAEEYAKIIDVALENQVIKEVMQTTYYEIRPLNHRAFAIGTTNKLLKTDNGYEVEGGKTGFTDGSDYNFATKVKKGDKEVVVVVFGDQSLNQAIENSKKLADEVLNKNAE